MTSLADAAKGVEDAARTEENKLVQLRQDEQALQDELAKAEQRVQDLHAHLADKGREIKQQEQVAAKAAHLAKRVYELDIELHPFPSPPVDHNAPAPIGDQAAAATPTAEDPLGVMVADGTADTQALQAVGKGRR